MSLFNKYNILQNGTLWSLMLFVLSFIKALVITPLMLITLGTTNFAFWVTILSIRAIVLFLPDGYIRYITNQYNILYHQNPLKAKQSLASGISFLVIFLVLLVLILSTIIYFIPHCITFIFHVESIFISKLQLALSIYLIASSIQVLQRLFATTQEALGFIWKNIALDFLIILVEIIVLGYMLINKSSFLQIVIVDSIIIASIAFSYIIYLSVKYQTHLSFCYVQLQNGFSEFKNASKLYISNIFEKLSTDGLVLLLSLSGFNKGIISIFATTRTIINTPILTQNLLLNKDTPKMQGYYSTRNTIGFQKLLENVRFPWGIALSLGLILFLPFSKVFISWWTKGNINITLDFMAIMSIMAIIHLWGLSFSFILKGLNATHELSKIMFLKCITIILGLLIIPQNIVAFATLLLVSEIFFSILLAPIETHKFLSKNNFKIHYKLLWKHYLAYSFSILIIVFIYILKSY